MMKKILLLLAFLSTGILVSANTFTGIGAAQAQDSASQNDEIERVRAELVKMIPPASDAKISTTDAAGVYQLEIQGNYAYAYVVGDHILIGDLLNTKTKVNIGETAQSARMAQLVSDVSTDKMIVFGPQDPKRFITVFTDIDCGYCRRLHREVPELTAAGIQVRYLAFPRAGIGSDSHKKYVSVWCNADSQEALTLAKQGDNVPSADCDNPVSESYQLGQQVGVRGTPTIIFDDGTVTPGYIPSDVLIERLGLSG